MKPSKYNFQEFEIPLGFNMFNALKNYFGIDDNTGDLKFCKYNYKTGIAAFSSKMLPFIYDFLVENNLDTSALNDIAKYIKSIKVPIDISSPKI